jgi:hypothetical protein
MRRRMIGLGWVSPVLELMLRGGSDGGVENGSGARRKSGKVVLGVNQVVRS